MLTMPKWKLLVLGISCAALACTTFLASHDPSALWLGLPAALFLGLWFFRFQRDRRIITQAAAWREQQAVTAAQQLPPVASKGTTNRLFVPPPLH
jgi:hypothetical protein